MLSGSNATEVETQRLSQTLCKPPVWCRIDTPYRRFIYAQKEGAVRLPADIDVLQGHTTALTYHLPGRTEQDVNGDIEQPGEQLQSFCVGHRFTGLPAGNHLTGHMHLFRQLLLGEPRLVRSSRKISLVSMLITTLPGLYHGGSKKQSNWLLPQFCFTLALGVSVFNKLYTKKSAH